jgi:hypothetical protein
MIVLAPEVRVADTLGAVNVVIPANAVLCGKQPTSGVALAVDFAADSVYINKFMIAT